MIKFLCIFALTFAVASAGKVKFVDCGHNEVSSLDVSGCEGDYCVLHKGKPLSLDMKCTSNQDSEHLKVVISAEVDGIEIEVPGFDQDGCHYVQCPVHKGQQYDVKYTYNVPAILPNIKAELTAKVIGDSGLLGCLKIKGEIAD
ncbi:Group 2 mite allergen-like protein (lipid binding protein) [Euroglyphus maynei]|uniref:Group 2 mite allergen-like protein (Lipid binding protein) n=1 Tax=Euroglyphus maynei TaxID=6958 RepID=A0A1Y3BSH9_EURMA|nr:Group 2 mite allergen-like protein (lipid binding protein) [Euroglyphus maynei]